MAGMLGDILIDRGQLTEAQLNTALKTKHPGQMLGDRLLAMGVVSSAQLGSALAEQFEVPFIDVEPQAVDSQIVRLLPEDFLRQSQIVLIEIGDQQMTLAMVSPDDIGYFCIQVHPELTNHRPLSVRYVRFLSGPFQPGRLRLLDAARCRERHVRLRIRTCRPLGRAYE